MTGWDEKSKTTALILLVAVPSFIGNTAARLIVLALCLSAAFFLAAQWSRKFRMQAAAKLAAEKAGHADLINSLMKPVRNHLIANVRMALVLTNQLKEVTLQTEQAVLEMGDKFMGIASRARKHAEKAWSSFEGIECLARQMAIRAGESGKGFSGADDGEQSAAAIVSRPTIDRAVEEAPVKLADFMSLAKGRLDELKTETEALGADINGIIVAMQFQDITRQRIERVIMQLVQFRQETEQLLQKLQGMSAAEGQHGGGQLERIYTMESERAVVKETLLALDRIIT